MMQEIHHGEDSHLGGVSVGLGPGSLQICTQRRLTDCPKQDAFERERCS